jgi:hypothetical protein
MRLFEANGFALGFVGQWVNRELVRYDEAKPRNFPLRFQRVRIINHLSRDVEGSNCVITMGKIRIEM